MSVGKDEVTVVLPTLNEEEAIGKVIEELRQAGYRNVPVVDGYSIDGTVKVAKLSDACSGMYLINTRRSSHHNAKPTHNPHVCRVNVDIRYSVHYRNTL